MRAFRKNIANELKDLPVRLTVHGGAVAEVREPGEWVVPYKVPEKPPAVTMDELQSRYMKRKGIDK